MCPRHSTRPALGIIMLLMRWPTRGLHVIAPFILHTYLIYMNRIACLILAFIAGVAPLHSQIRVTENGTALQTMDGKPFFWLGDTDWELFHRLSREEAAAFIDIRSRQGFNVLQAVALAEFNGVREPNYYGDFPLNNEDPTNLIVTPGNDPSDSYQYDYWDHVDYIIGLAAAKGIYIGLLPTWGDM